MALNPYSSSSNPSHSDNSSGMEDKHDTRYNNYGRGRLQHGGQPKYSLSNSPYQEQSNVINLQGQNSRKSFNSSNILQRANTIERVSSIIGPMYCIGFLAGSSINGGISLYNQLRKRSKLMKSKKIFISKILNSVLKGGEKFANVSGGITLLFLCVCKFNSFLFLEEQEMIGPMASNILNGSLSGLLVGMGLSMGSKSLTVNNHFTNIAFKSTLGKMLIPVTIGSAIGYLAYYMTTRSSRLRGIV